MVRLARPWDRADCAGAARFVQARWQGGEAVYGNHWEAEYYFRQAPGRFAYVPPEGVRGNERFWVVLASARPQDRSALLEFLARDRQVIERREFDGVTAALLAPAYADASR
jgi:hypothetical protein